MPGSLDENGVWLFAEDDARDTMSQLLNIGQDSISDAIGADRARLAALEATGAWSGVLGNVVTASTGWAIGTTHRGAKKNGIAYIDVSFQRTGATVTALSTGDLSPDETLGQFQSGWAPRAGMVFMATCYNRMYTIRLSSSGILWTAGLPSFPCATNDTIVLSSIYPLA